MNVGNSPPIDIRKLNNKTLTARPAQAESWVIRRVVDDS
jgi:hypothetical protein